MRLEIQHISQHRSGLIRPRQRHSRCLRAATKSDPARTVLSQMTPQQQPALDADDLTTLVRFGHPLELKREPGADLVEIVHSAADGINVEVESNYFRGD